MDKRRIDFAVTGQEIAFSVADPAPRGDTQQYLTAHFSVDASWAGLSLLAVFQRKGGHFSPVTIPLDASMACDFPPSLLTAPDGGGTVYLRVGLVGVDESGKRLTTGCAAVPIAPSCYVRGETPRDPSQDVYTQLLGGIDAKLDANQGAANAGKVLGIGEDGVVVPVDAPTGGGEGGIATEADPTVPAWAKQPEKPSYTADEVGAISQDGLGVAVNQALAAAKAAGEFDGKDGNPGKTAFAYAQDGGYVGTEEEFAAKLADGTTQAYVDAEIADLKAQGVQQVPLYAESVEWLDANGDKTKLYVLPDGYIYHYDKRLEEVETTVTAPARAAVIVGKRYSLSGAAFKDCADGSAIVVPIRSTDKSFKISVQNLTLHHTYQSVYLGVTNSAFTMETARTWSADGSYFTISDAGVGAINSNKFSFLVFFVSSTGVSGQYNNSKLFVNGEEADLVVTADPTIAALSTITTTTETVVTDGFVSTGRAFVPADYEDRIVELEETAETVKKNTRRISKLESTIGDTAGEADPANYLNSVHCPPQLPANGEEGTDFNLHTFADFGDGFHAYFDDLVARYPHYLVREYLGKDESETLNMYRYVLGKHYYSAWCQDNYPRMYAWKHGSTIVYSTSVAPRIGDTMYSTAYVGTAYSTVTAVSATDRTRTANGIAFVRYAEGDIAPAVCYTPAYNPYNRLVNARGELVIGISAIDGDVLTDVNGKTYRRYPFGDLKKDGTQPIHMTIIANEHGGDSEPGIPAVVTARLIRDLCSGQCSSDNPVYRYLRDNVQLTVIPAVNPHGLNKFPAGAWDGYHNANNVNINRNYDTPGWDVYLAEHPDEAYRMGDYPGSENETQYVMNTMADSEAVVAMSVHTISCLVTAIISRCMYQGQNPDGGYTQPKIDEIADDMKASYNLEFVAYDPLECPPETTSKSPSFITQLGAYGGIVEFQCHDPLSTEEEISTDASMFTSAVMGQNYSLLLKFIAMWLSDYLNK